MHLLHARQRQLGPPSEQHAAMLGKFGMASNPWHLEKSCAPRELSLGLRQASLVLS